MGWSEGRRDRGVLVGWLVGMFGLSALRDPRLLGAAALVSLVVLRRGVGRNLRRTALSVVPLTLGLSLISALVLRLSSGAWPDLGPFGALGLRTAVMALVTFSVLDRVSVVRALGPFPTASRLVAMTLAQVHAFRLVLAESRNGLESRLPNRPAALDVLRSAGGVTAMLLAMAARNAREIADAMRARGF